MNQKMKKVNLFVDHRAETGAALRFNELESKLAEIGVAPPSYEDSERLPIICSEDKVKEVIKIAWEVLGNHMKDWPVEDVENSENPNKTGS